MLRLSAISAAVVLDWIFGEPEGIPHPVCMMGSLISRMETWIRRRIPGQETVGGVCLAAAVLFVSVLVPGVILRGMFTGGRILADCVLGGSASGNGVWWSRVLHGCTWCLETFWCFQLLAAKSLFQESGKVRRELEAGNREGARRQVAGIVGRDTNRLDEEGIARAAVETVAENTSDGVIAPLLFMALFGVLGGFFYKAVNTMDSMVGYKNERYRHFGWAAAKLDDICNFLPARLSGCLMAAAAGLLGCWDQTFDGRMAWKIFLRDRKKHESPNSAHGEAACAGALHLRLGGENWYFGKLHQKPWIGDGGRKIEAEDIRRAGQLMLAAEVLMLGLCWAVWFFLRRCLPGWFF